MYLPQIVLPRQVRGKQSYEDDQETIIRLAAELVGEDVKKGIKLTRVSTSNHRTVFKVEGCCGCSKIILRKNTTRLAFQFFPAAPTDVDPWLLARLAAREIAFLLPENVERVEICREFSATEAANAKEALSDFMQEFFEFFHPDVISLVAALDKEGERPFAQDSLDIRNVRSMGKRIAAEVTGSEICTRVELVFLPQALEFHCYGYGVKDGRYQQLVWAAAAALAESYLTAYYLMDHDGFYAQSTIPVPVPDSPEDVILH